MITSSTADASWGKVAPEKQKRRSELPKSPFLELQLKSLIFDNRDYLVFTCSPRQVPCNMGYLVKHWNTLCMKEWPVLVIVKALPHLCFKGCFKVVHFPGHGNQSILVKQKRSKPEVLNMVPHYFPRGFSRTTIHQREDRRNLLHIEGIFEISYSDCESRFKSQAFYSDPKIHQVEELHTKFSKSVHMKVLYGAIRGLRKVWPSSSWDICEHVSFTSYPKLFNSTLAFPQWHHHKTERSNHWLLIFSPVFGYMLLNFPACMSHIRLLSIPPAAATTLLPLLPCPGLEAQAFGNSSPIISFSYESTFHDSQMLSK